MLGRDYLEMKETRSLAARNRVTNYQSARASEWQAVSIAGFLYSLIRHWAHKLIRLQRKQTGASIEQEKQFQVPFDLMPQLGWTARPDGFIDFYNKGWY